MSCWVRRTRTRDGRVGWTGPIRSLSQAEREAAAWNESSGFTAEIVPSTPYSRALVRAWIKERRLDNGR